MSETMIAIPEEMAGELEQALNLCIGMASVHSPDSQAGLVALAGRLSDAINAALDDPA